VTILLYTSFQERERINRLIFYGFLKRKKRDSERGRRRRS
jgi:hypothetical protein